MKQIQRTEISTTEKLRSLCWYGDGLVDFASGILEYGLDGKKGQKLVDFGYGFDRAVSTQDGQYAVLYDRNGTKGIITKEGTVLREINRGFYRADTYEFPIALFTWADGRTVIAHCPDQYCKIEIEDIETGERLSTRDNEPMDIYHSRLEVSSDNRYMIDSGWVTQPLNTLQIFDLGYVSQNPAFLDTNDGLGAFWSAFTVSEIHSATFQCNDTVLVSGDVDEAGSTKYYLGVWSITANQMLSLVPIEEPTGRLMSINEDYAIAFSECPKLYEVKTGEIVQTWKDIKCGCQISSITWGFDLDLHLALDPANARFAVGKDMQISVIEMG